MAMKRIIYDIANPQVTAFFIYSTSPISLSNLSILSSYSPLICRNTGDARPVRRDFGDLAFPQGEELIPHIDALRRMLSSPGGNQTASSPSRMMLLLLQYGSPDGFLLFL